jgi:hypothetical protein
VLVDDGTLHCCIVRNIGDVRSGAKVTLEITRDVRVTLSRGLERRCGRGGRDCDISMIRRSCNCYNTGEDCIS